MVNVESLSSFPSSILMLNSCSQVFFKSLDISLSSCSNLSVLPSSPLWVWKWKSVGKERRCRYVRVWLLPWIDCALMLSESCNKSMRGCQKYLNRASFYRWKTRGTGFDCCPRLVSLLSFFAADYLCESARFVCTVSLCMPAYYLDDNLSFVNCENSFAYHLNHLMITFCLLIADNRYFLFLQNCKN